MILKDFKKSRRAVAVLLFAFFFSLTGTAARAATSKQQSLDQWRNLTSPTAEAPRVFVKGNEIRFYFQGRTNELEFSADWSHLRVPTEGYKVNSALVRWKKNLSRLPELDKRGWREATVIAGAEWRRLSTNLQEALTPKSPGHGAYYQAFLSDRILYRDAQGAARFALDSEQPAGVVIDHLYPLEETLEVLARHIEAHLVQNHPGDTLFLIMAPNASRFTEPLLLDRQRRQCVWLSPAALYDTTERGLGFANSARGFGAFLVEGQGLALIKNPVSSAARLVDLGIETAVHLLQLPLPKPATAVPALAHTNGMDLVAWEKWLDRYTGTRLEDGSMRLLIDGDRFYPRLQQAIAQATNHISMNLYIFDRDDVAVSFADELKQRSAQVRVHLVPDQMGTLAAGLAPPATPMPENFVMPASIISYLRHDSRVRVHPFLNPWFSTDHQKIYLVDGAHAWVGGMNIGREYRYEWHDLMFELNGPVVASLEREFRRDWAHESLLGDFAYAAALLTPPRKPVFPPGSNQWIKVRRLPTRTGWKPFSNAVRAALRRTQRCIYVENPYLFDKGIIAELVEARARGVDVRVVMPRVNDFKAGGRSNLIVANYLHEHGVRVYFYPGMTHVKALLVDGWACLGSGNLNHLSLHLCQEQNIATSDPAFAARLKHDLFEADFARSYELNQSISVDWVDFVADTVLEGF
jgi:phosphatidylserine/phosphatidylglycerophosphate/cardiolipin synthase-like enzyme